jgi:hypothetical protein
MVFIFSFSLSYVWATLSAELAAHHQTAYEAALPVASLSWGA